MNKFFAWPTKIVCEILFLYLFLISLTVSVDRIELLYHFHIYTAALSQQLQFVLNILAFSTKSAVSLCVAVLRLIVANPEIRATWVLIGHVVVEEGLLVILQDLQTEMLETLVQIAVLNEVNQRDLWVHLAIVVDELQNGQLIRVLVAGLGIVIHLVTCAWVAEHYCCVELHNKLSINVQRVEVITRVVGISYRRLQL